MITTLVFGHAEMPVLLGDAYPSVTRENAERYGADILDTVLRYAIDTPLRFSHWLAQIGHESGQLKYTEEIASGRAYEGRRSLGNTQSGDGVRFKGRGLIQLTGRYNYARYARDKKLPQILEEPQRVAEPPLCVDVAGWFWVKGASVDLNRVADKDNVVLLTKLINGGYNGLDDRKALLKTSRRAVDRIGTLIVQSALNAGHKRGSRWPSLMEDGLFGPQTASVVREMQGEYMLRPTGIVDLKTWNKLKELRA